VKNQSFGIHCYVYNVKINIEKWTQTVGYIWLDSFSSGKSVS